MNDTDDDNKVYVKLLSKSFVKYISYQNFTIGRINGYECLTYQIYKKKQNEKKEEEKNIQNKNYADIGIGYDKSISRIHCQILFNTDLNQYQLKLKSINGIYINGIYINDINTIITLKSLDIIQISNEIFYFILPQHNKLSISTNYLQEFINNKQLNEINLNNTFYPNQSIIKLSINNNIDRSIREKIRILLLNWGIGSWDKINNVLKLNNLQIIINYTQYFLLAITNYLDIHYIRK